MQFLSLILSLPTENATVRMRAWRALKSSGAAVLRDGVYLMPERAACREFLESVASDMQSAGGSAYVLRMEEPAGANFVQLFDRGEDYCALMADAAKVLDSLTADNVLDVLKQVRKLRKSYASLADIDFYPGEAQKQADAALLELEMTAARVLAPDEPRAASGSIARLAIADYQRRVWATRQRPWVDRLACAWLIRRFIDPHATLLWLATPADCPKDALGFDFDGATFTHVGARVSFEVLIASFGLENAGLKRLGTLVHYLDAGGVQPAEASGIESVLAGLRESITDDDQLAGAAGAIFDGLLSSFSKEGNT